MTPCRSVPVYFEWFSYLSWFRYGNEALLINQWSEVEFIECTRSNATCPKSGRMVLQTFNFKQVLRRHSFCYISLRTCKYFFFFFFLCLNLFSILGTFLDRCCLSVLLDRRIPFSGISGTTVQDLDKFQTEIETEGKDDGSRILLNIISRLLLLSRDQEPRTNGAVSQRTGVPSVLRLYVIHFVDDQL